jgi:hypothetical protein
MKSHWFKGLKTKKEKEEREKEVKSFNRAFSELEKILLENYKKRPAERDYNNSGWMYKQIATNEYNQAVDDLLELIRLER